jgi:hypothetical protein
LVKELLGILGILVLLLKSIVFYEDTGFADSSKRRKKKNDRGNQPFATQKRTGLSFLPGGERETDSFLASKSGLLATAERARGTKEKGFNRRLLLPEQSLCVLWDNRRGDPCADGVWNAWDTGSDPGFQMSGVREEVYCEKEHDPVPAEKSFGIN